MKLVFTGLMNEICLSRKQIAVVEVSSPALFARLCQSLLVADPAFAQEQYSLWSDDKKELNPKTMMLHVPNPFQLPWEDKRIMGKLYELVSGRIDENLSTRENLERLDAEIRSSIAQIDLQMHSDYTFALQWDTQRYLKAFSFGVDICEDGPLFDNLMKFLSTVNDVSFRGVLVFYQIRNFFSETEFKQLCEQLIFFNIPALFLEGTIRNDTDQDLWKLAIDQDFLEQTTGK